MGVGPEGEFGQARDKTRVELPRRGTRGLGQARPDARAAQLGPQAFDGLRLAGRRGTVSVIGVAQDRRFDFPMSRAFGSGLTFRIGTCSVPETWPELIPLIQSGRLKPEKYISHVLPLSEGAHAYALSDNKSEGALKMVLTP